MISRAAAFLIWALVAAAAVFWGLRLTVRGPSAPQATLASPQALPTRAEWSRVLGSTPLLTSPASAAPELSARFVLSGVMAPRASDNASHNASHKTSKQNRGPGLALIAVDGQPPKPYALGATIDGELTLLAVTYRSASIGPQGGAALVTLQLPDLPRAATGTLPTVVVPPGQSMTIQPANRPITAEQAR